MAMEQITTGYTVNPRCVNPGLFVMGLRPPNIVVVYDNLILGWYPK